MNHTLGNQFNRVLLRPLSNIEIEQLRILRNQERKWFIYSDEIDKESQKAWFYDYLQKSDDYMFSVFHVDKPNSFIGAVALYNFRESTCELGRILINRTKTKEKGFGYDTVVCASKIAFDQLGVQKIVLEVFKDNISAIKTYLKAGFITYDESERIQRMELIKR